MKRLIGLLLLSICIHAPAQQNQTLQQAIKAFNDSDDLNGMLKSVILFKQAETEDADNWMTSYWAAFAYSQCGRLTENAQMYYDTAQTYLDKTMEKVSSLNNRQQSDVYILQSLLHSLNAYTYWAQGDRAMGMKLNQAEGESLNKAVTLNIDNPRVYLLTATGLISDGKRTKNDGYIIAGKKMLEVAQEKYSANKPEDPLYPDWGSGWVNFWLSNAKLSGED